MLPQPGRSGYYWYPRLLFVLRCVGIGVGIGHSILVVVPYTTSEMFYSFVDRRSYAIYVSLYICTSILTHVCQFVKSKVSHIG